MAEELESLLNRINEEGLKKADEERQRILDQARQEADRIVSEAKEEASRLRKEAEEEAQLHREKGRQALEQAARDTLLALRSRLQEELQRVVQESVRAEVGAENIGSILEELVKAYLQREQEVSRIEVLLPEQRLEELRSALTARFGEELKQKTEFKPVSDISGGFQLSINEQSVVYDFSDEALAEAICTYLSPRLTDVVNTVLRKDAETDQQAEAGGGHSGASSS